jgi:hypothetical protein
MGGGADRVAHVVQAVEHRHQVVPVPRVLLGRGDLEARAIADAGFDRCASCPRDRCLVVVEPHEARTRERLRHQDRRRPVAAADVGDARPGS